MEERPWLKIFPDGVPANINVEKYSSIVEMYTQSCEKYAKEVAFDSMGKSLTYKDLFKKSTAFGAYLQSRGLVAGDRIALMMPNLLQYPIALFGCLQAGLLVVNTNPLYTKREMEHQFVDADVKAIVICENFAKKLQDIKSHTQIDIVITTGIGDMLGGIKSKVVNFMVRRVKRMVPTFEIPNAVDFKNALAQGSKFSLKQTVTHPDDTVILQYTGGTTGVSKGAMLTNKNLVSNMQQIGAMMQVVLEERTEVALCALPMYHIFALTVNCLSFMLIGAKNVMIVNARDLDSVGKAFEKHPISIVTGVNTLFNALMNNERFKKLDFSPLKITIGGGMAVQQIVAEKWHALTGCYLAQGYGLTESSPVASVNPLTIDKGRTNSIGLPLPSTDMRVVDESGNALAVGEVGEIQIKGPQVMKGYYKRPEETTKVISADKWLSTGDIGKMDADGFFYIVDRKKDMILVSGFNVYPNEVEEVVAAHPKVQEVCAIGVPDPKSSEVVKIYVVKQEESLTEKELKAYCKENLTGYKCPKQIEFRKELPKSNVGKILRRVLKNELVEG